MINPDNPNKPFYWSVCFMRELYRAGVRHIIISPGSRSTPLVLAAAVHHGFENHIILDERSAGFTALGIGKSTGIPAALICTSGTAVANYYPSIIEARQSGTPLLVLSADRPPHLRDIGASQAIDQHNIFGTYPVFFYDTGEPFFEEVSLRRLTRSANQAVSKSVAEKGPSHINFPFRKPLEPESSFLQQVRTEIKTGGDAGKPAVTVYRTEESVPLPDPVIKLMADSEKPLIVTGPINPFESVSGIGKLASRLQAPVISESCISDLPQKYGITGFSSFLRDRTTLESLNPDLIIRFGQSPVSKAVNHYLEQYRSVPQVEFALLDHWQDVSCSTSHRIEIASCNFNLESYSNLNAGHKSWLAKWKKTEQAYHKFKDHQIKKTVELSDPFVFDRMVGQIPESWNIFLSNSFPVRDYFLVNRSTQNKLFLNRGASGIDGVISTAIGATAASGTPGILFIGDLAFLHDSNALLNRELLGKIPLIIAVINNNGGTIFRMLPIAKHREYYTSYFETPQNINFQELSRAYELHFARIDNLNSLKELNLEKAAEKPGIQILEFVTDPSASMTLRNSLWNFKLE